MNIRWLLPVLMLLLASCATTRSPMSMTGEGQIGPFTTFHGRMIVMTPSRRWQVSIQWQTEDARRGYLRLLHPSTGFVLEARWKRPQVELRDSKYPQWRNVSIAEMQQQGILLPPWEMAAILQGDIPASFHVIGAGRWQRHVDDTLLRLQWQAGQQRLTLTDITHGRRIILVIESWS